MMMVTMEVMRQQKRSGSSEELFPRAQEFSRLLGTAKEVEESTKML